jgi:hypothetical protein
MLGDPENGQGGRAEAWMDVDCGSDFSYLTLI